MIVLKSVILSLTPSTTANGSITHEPRRLVTRLAKSLDTISNSRARASIFWLVGQFAESDEGGENGSSWDGVAAWVPDVLRKGVKGFIDEVSMIVFDSRDPTLHVQADIVKLQILSLTARVLVLSPSTGRLHLLARYLFSLARYDASYDIRDRARLLYALLRGIRAEYKASKESAGLNGDIEDEDDDEEDMSGVVLRREQVKVILFSKASGTAEDVPGKCYLPLL